MSEYQFYEFQALDSPLTPEAQAEIRRVSSRVQMTATSASFVYNYGDFRGNPYLVLAEYFDAMLYVTNWGTRQLMFRFPVGVIPDYVMSNYQYANSVEWSTEDEYVILNIELNKEDDYDGWIEGEGILPSVIQVRNDILRGDYRTLYLAWLMIAEYELEVLEDDEDLTEPPVPSNLQALSPALRNFIDFFRIDFDLVIAASQASPTAEKIDKQLSASIDRLSEKEKRDFLDRVLRNEPNLDIALTNRLRELSGADKVKQPGSEHRTIRQMLAVSKVVRQQRLEAEQQKANTARLKKLERIALEEDQLWARIPGLIEQKKANTYDEAVNILKDLRDLTTHQQRMTEFQDKLTAIRGQYPTLQGLHRRLKEVGLV
jgi:hypothetical protein